MNKFLNKIVDAMSAILSGREEFNLSMASFLQNGNNGIIVLAVLLFIPFLIVSFYLYNTYLFRSDG